MHYVLCREYSQLITIERDCKIKHLLDVVHPDEGLSKHLLPWLDGTPFLATRWPRRLTL